MYKPNEQVFMSVRTPDNAQKKPFVLHFNGNAIGMTQSMAAICTISLLQPGEWQPDDLLQAVNQLMQRTGHPDISLSTINGNQKALHRKLSKYGYEMPYNILPTYRLGIYRREGTKFEQANPRIRSLVPASLPTPVTWVDATEAEYPVLYVNGEPVICTKAGKSRLAGKAKIAIFTMALFGVRATAEEVSALSGKSCTSHSLVVHTSYLRRALQLHGLTIPERRKRNAPGPTLAYLPK